MAKPDRVALINELQKERGTQIISYVTSTRVNLEVNMAMDAVRIIYRQLRLLDQAAAKTGVDLFLHSNGGEGTVPWRLVPLIREYTDRFSVLVPNHAFSAATLTALGADHIVMHPLGVLGPTDPTVANAFNPRDPGDPSKRVGISVEDVTAYLALIKEDAGIQHEDELVQAFNKLADNIHPLALGNVKRSLSQSRLMARKLLTLHMDIHTDEHKINEIVENLTSKLFFHGHPINRTEARQEIGLTTVENPPEKVEGLIWELYSDYEAEMKMQEPFMPALEFVAKYPTLNPGKSAETNPVTAKIAYIESAKRTDVFILEYKVAGQKQNDGSTKTSTIHVNQGWATE